MSFPEPDDNFAPDDVEPMIKGVWRSVTEEEVPNLPDGLAKGLAVKRGALLDMGDVVATQNWRDLEHVRRLTDKALKGKGRNDPFASKRPLVWYDGKKYWILDGHHRALAEGTGIWPPSNKFHADVYFDPAKFRK